MADLTHILGGAFTPPTEKHIDPPEIQLRDAMIASGIEPPETVHLDGQVHRFRSGTKGKPGEDKAGWYVGYSDGIPAGRFGCWRAGIEQSWRADVGRTLSPAEEMAHARRMAQAQAARDAERKRKQEVASDTVSAIWENAGAASADHPYLARKGIQPHGSRVTGDGRLIVPLYDDNGELSSLQYIDAEGGKKYHPGGATGGRFYSIGALDEPGRVYIAEGFATAATIFEATGRPCFVAYSASNLVPVTGYVREQYSDVVIVADNDQSGVGQRYAEQASAKYGARVVVPDIPGDANDYAQSGHDLSSLLDPPVDDWLIPADDFSAQPAPISWMVKRWLQRDALIMFHGPSGGGKTFVVLDMSLRIAAGFDDWMGNKVRPGRVVYLAGEGHHGLRGRVAAWKQRNRAQSLDMFLSRDGCDLNTPAGYQRVCESLRALDKPPCLIVVDTLHRFLHGDENSAQDAKTMLDACAGLIREFGASVVLVHHTGNSDEAQHRARGSSAWRGALDIEVSVVPGTDEKPIQIVQRKSKDAELAGEIWAELETVEIEGWIDEDGEAVTSAVLAESEAPRAADKSAGGISTAVKTFERAWWASGCEERHGAPYLSRSALIDMLVSNDGLSQSSATNYAKPSYANGPIAKLITGEIIAAHEHGWVMRNDVQASALLMRKNGS